MKGDNFIMWKLILSDGYDAADTFKTALEEFFFGTVMPFVLWGFSIFLIVKTIQNAIIMNKDGASPEEQAAAKKRFTVLIVSSIFVFGATVLVTVLGETLATLFDGISI